MKRSVKNKNKFSPFLMETPTEMNYIDNDIVYLKGFPHNGQFII